MQLSPKYPIVDLHCDLLCYLANYPEATVHDTDNIGVAWPYMKTGGVKHQVLAMFSFSKPGSVAFVQQQTKAYLDLLQTPYFYPITHATQADTIPKHERIGVTAAIENASGLCEENENLDLTFERLDELLKHCGHLFYIGFTHHTENRFGGGNYSDNIGLHRDGELLLEYLDGKGIAADLAHASDNLAYGIINHIDKLGLKVPVIASHSNFRSISPHVRNLPDELVAEVHRRQGLMGMNFLRAYIHPTEPDHFFQHFFHGLRQYPDQLAWGADFFDRFGITDPERIPLFFPQHEDATKYPELLNVLEENGFEEEGLTKLCYGNVQAYMKRNWA